MKTLLVIGLVLAVASAVPQRRALRKGRQNVPDLSYLAPAASAPVKTSYLAPAAAPAAPSDSYGAAAADAPSDSYGAAAPEAPSDSYGAAAAEAPSDSYGAASEDAPLSSYGAVAEETTTTAAPLAAAPASSYGAANDEEEEEEGEEDYGDQAADPPAPVAPQASYGAATDDAPPSYGNNELAAAASDAGASGGDGLKMLMNAVPGVPGEDYPIFAEAPETAFSCEGKVDGGYYADDEARCQVFHICSADGQGGLAKYSFLCPNGTIFNQNYFICDWWFNFDCAEAKALFSKNAEIAAERAALDAAASNSVASYAAPAADAAPASYAAAAPADAPAPAAYDAPREARQRAGRAGGNRRQG